MLNDYIVVHKQYPITPHEEHFVLIPPVFAKPNKYKWYFKKVKTVVKFLVKLV